MTDKEKNDLNEIADNIKSLENKLTDANRYDAEYIRKFNDFEDSFQEKKGMYLIYGVICLAVLVFDFWISEKSMEYLSIILGISVALIALIFTFIDGGLAILASGGLAGNNSVKVKKWQKQWTPILIIMAVIKIALFIGLLFTHYNSETSSQMGLSENLKIILPQILFVIIVYSVLGKAGFGLWYVVGLAYFALRKFLLPNSISIENKLKEEISDFHKTCERYKIDAKQTAREFQIDGISKN